MVLVSTSMGNESKCAAEAISLFERVLETNQEPEADITSKSVSASLEEELQEMREQQKTNFKPFFTFNTGNVLIQWYNTIAYISNLRSSKSQNTVELIERVFAFIESEKQSHTRYVNRMVPFEHTYFSSMEALETAISSFLKPHLPTLKPAETVFEYRFHF